MRVYSTLIHTLGMTVVLGSLAGSSLPLPVNADPVVPLNDALPDPRPILDAVPSPCQCPCARRAALFLADSTQLLRCPYYLGAASHPL